METLMNEKGPSNRGDRVKEEPSYRPDSVTKEMLFRKLK